MATNVLLLHYNNYSNRIVKKLATVDEYKAADVNYSICNNINFVPGDGLMTSLVLGYGNNPSNVFDNGANFDYVVVMDSTAPTYNILSRWFIIEANRTRDKQYELVLKRDVIADNYEEVLNAPAYIEKATITDETDPLIFNSEGFLVNQIKETETPLKDETKCGWVVGYIPSTWEGGVINADVVVGSGQADISVEKLSNWSYWKNVRSNAAFKYMSSSSGDNKINLKVGWINYDPQSGSDSEKTWNGSTLHFTTSNYINSTNEKTYTTPNFSAPAPEWWSDYHVRAANNYNYTNNIPVSDARELVDRLTNDTMRNYVNAVIGGSGSSVEIVSQSTVNNLLALRSKIIKDNETGNYYRIDITEISVDNPVEVSTSTSAGQNLINYINSQISASSNWTGTATNGDVSVQLSAPSYAIDLVQISVSCQVNITADRYHLSDNPYDMFCIPYSSDIQINTGETTFKCVKEVALSIANKIAASTGSGSIYDVQLLPYCPARHIIAGSTTPSSVLNVSKGKYNIINNVKDQTSTPVSCVIWCMSSSFLVPINDSINIQRTATITLIDPNVQPDGSLDQNRPLCVYDIAPAGDYPKDDQGEYAMQCVESGNYVDQMKVRFMDKQSGILLREFWANKIMLNCYTDSSRNTLSITSIKKPTDNITYTKAEFDNLDYYIIIEFINTGIGAKGIGYGYPWATACKYVSINYKNSSALDLKMSNELDLYRLCSPNYNGFFEFSVAKSYGVDGFVAECTYKPFNPYIHVTPKLKGLYGENYVNIDDSRGLICGGDFSLPQLNSAWANYELSNKNYQKVFDRQMQNMDVNNAIARQEAGWQIFAGTLQGGATAATAGGMIGKGYMALASGVIGGATSLAAGMTDYANLVARQEEAKSYATDMYNYSLQNIKAIPNSLTKSSALTFNTRIWPFVEYYTCTPKEKVAFRNKLKYNGMTVMKIGKIADYKVQDDLTYVKGQIIRLANVNGESALASEIYKEINKGVYL